MRDDDSERPRRSPGHVVGETLDTLSVEEITERIALLQAEIARLEAAKSAKTAARDKAGSIFRL